MRLFASDPIRHAPEPRRQLPRPREREQGNHTQKAPIEPSSTRLCWDNASRGLVERWVYFRQPINTGLPEGIEEAEDIEMERERERSKEKGKQTSHSLILNCDFNPHLIIIWMDPGRTLPHRSAKQHAQRIGLRSHSLQCLHFCNAGLVRFAKIKKFEPFF